MRKQKNMQVYLSVNHLIYINKTRKGMRTTDIENKAAEVSHSQEGTGYNLWQFSNGSILLFSAPFFPYFCFWPVCISAYSSGSSVLHIRSPSAAHCFSGLKLQKTSKYSPFRALTLALAGTLGVGNIVGVAVALTARRQRCSLLDGIVRVCHDAA